MIIYGRKIVLEYLSQNKKVNKAFLYENLNDSTLLSEFKRRKIEPILLSKNQLDRMEGGNHQGVMLQIPDYSFYSLDNLLDSTKEKPFFLILDHLEDPHNVGAIIRTAVAAGVDGIIMPKDRSADIGPTVMKTSAGGLENIKIALVTNVNETIKKLKTRGFWVYGTGLKDSVSYAEANYDGSLAIVIGNEGKGISKLTETLCDELLNIPIFGKIESLNASVAAGIIMYKAIETRRK